MFSMCAKVKEQFTERTARLSDADLQNHPKLVAFKESIKSSLNQGKACAEKRWGEKSKCIHRLLNATHSELTVDFDNSCACRRASQPRREREKSRDVSFFRIISLISNKHTRVGRVYCWIIMFVCHTVAVIFCFLTVVLITPLIKKVATHRQCHIFQFFVEIMSEIAAAPVLFSQPDAVLEVTLCEKTYLRCELRWLHHIISYTTAIT